MKRPVLVQKFGGAALEKPAHFGRVADIIEAKKDYHLVVVVSAMGKTTDYLLRLAREIHDDPPKRELDMLVSVGERISMSLLAMELKKRGIDAVSFTGSQSGIITSEDHHNAEILEVRPVRIVEALEKGRVVIVAGFQGVSRSKEITTLGRGGSDTSAVALGVALGAEKVEFYKDVDGVYSADPKTDPSATLFASISYSEALQVCGKILHPRSILLASKNKLPLHVIPFNTRAAGTVIHADCAGK